MFNGSLSKKALLATIFLLAFSGAFAPVSAQAQTVPENEIFEGLELGYIQLYLDFDSLSADSSETPTMVATAVYEMSSDRAAADAFDLMRDDLASDNEDFSDRKLDDLGNEARTITFTNEGSQFHVVIARERDTIVFSMEVDGNYKSQVAKNIVEFVLDEGPSRTEPSVDDEGIITGGWEPAFPQPDDIDGLQNMEPAEVFDLTSMGS